MTKQCICSGCLCCNNRDNSFSAVTSPPPPPPAREPPRCECSPSTSWLLDNSSRAVSRNYNTSPVSTSGTCGGRFVPPAKGHLSFSASNSPGFCSCVTLTSSSLPYFAREFHPCARWIDRSTRRYRHGRVQAQRQEGSVCSNCHRVPYTLRAPAAADVKAT